MLIRGILIFFGGVLVTIAFAVVFALTVWRDEVEQEVGERILEAAFGDDLDLIAAVAVAVTTTNQQHLTFACEESAEFSDGDQLAAALKLPPGDWVFGALVRSGDRTYVLVSDLGSGPMTGGAGYHSESSGTDGYDCFVPSGT
jgi:hypothetical protein